MPHGLFQFFVFSGNHQFFQQLRHTDVPYTIQFSAGSFPERTGKIGLTVSAGSTEDDMVPFLYVFAGRKLDHLFFAQFPVFEILNPFYRSSGDRKPRIVNTTALLVRLSAVPFRFYQHGKTVIERHIAVRFRIFLLTFQLGRHATEPHFLQQFNRGLTDHFDSPSFPRLL